jgi:UDP-N-acetylmuramate--alanine ligase
MLEELTTAFVETCRPEDCLFILPVFDAGGTANRTVTSGMLVDRLRERGVAADEAQDPDRLVAAVSSMAREGDTILTMGARDPGLPALARRMLAALPGAGA